MKRCALIFCVALFAMIAVAIMCVLGGYVDVDGGGMSRTVNFGRDVAEGLRVFDTKTGIDNIRFDYCRVDKVRSGPITFGGLNRLCVGGLVLNFPVDSGEEGCSGQPQTKRITDEPGAFLGFSSLPLGRFSSVKIEGLEVNKLIGRRAEPVFAADEAANRGKKIVLSNCRVFNVGQCVAVGKASIDFSPIPMLSWSGGSRRLDDILPMKVKK